MNVLFASVGIGLALSSAAGITAVLCRRRRAHAVVGRTLAWIAVGVVGLTGTASTLTESRPILVIGGVLAGCLVVGALVTGLVHARDVADARRRDAELGYPPIPRVASTATMLILTGLAALVLTVALVGSWLLVAAASAGISVDSIIPGLIIDTAVATPLVWLVVAAIYLPRHHGRVADADLLRSGIETRVADAETAAYHAGFAAGREEGYLDAAFGTSWE